MRGFFFLEVIIAVAIASLVFVALFTLTFQNLTAAEATRDRFLAANLAQEGIEIVVNMRSSNWLRFPSDIDTDGSLIKWRGETSCSAGGEFCLANGSGYIVQYDSTSLKTGDSSLSVDPNGRYCHQALDGVGPSQCDPPLAPSSFSRTISIEEVSAHQIKVVSTVNWNGNSVSVESRLYNWR